MKNKTKIIAFLLGCGLIVGLAVTLRANTVVNQAVTRYSGIAVDNSTGTTNGSNIYGMYLGTASCANASSVAVTVTGASATAKVFATKTSSATATYIKGVAMTANTATVTFSGTTTDTVNVIAIDSGSPTF